MEVSSSTTPAGAGLRYGPSATRVNARCRIQGDGSAWLHSPQVAIAASLPMSSFSWSPQPGGRDVIVCSCPCEEETDWTENFPGPGSAHRIGAPMGTWPDVSCCLQWGVGVGPHSQRGSSG